MSMITKHDLPAFLAKEVSDFLKAVDFRYVVVFTRVFEGTTRRQIHSVHVVLEEAIDQLLSLCEMYEMYYTQSYQGASSANLYHSAYITISSNGSRGETWHHCIGINYGWISLFKIESSFSEDELEHATSPLMRGTSTYMNRAIEYAAHHKLSSAQVVPVFTNLEDFDPPADPKLRIFHDECQRINKTSRILDHRKKVRTRMLKTVKNIENYEYRGEKFTWEK